MHSSQAVPRFSGNSSDAWEAFQSLENGRDGDEDVVRLLKREAREAWLKYATKNTTEEAYQAIEDEALAGNLKTVKISQFLPKARTKQGCGDRNPFVMTTGSQAASASTGGEPSPRTASSSDDNYSEYWPIVNGYKLDKSTFKHPETSAQRDLQLWVNKKTQKRRDKGYYSYITGEHPLTTQEHHKLQALTLQACGKRSVSELSEAQQSAFYSLSRQIKHGRGGECMEIFDL